MNLRHPGTLYALPLLIIVLFSALAIQAGEPEDLAAGQRAFDEGNYTRALKIWQPLAERGQADAQVLVGILHLNGWGTQQSEQRGGYWFLQAARQDNADGQFLLGMTYLIDTADEAATHQGVHWLNRAADNGDAAASAFMNKAHERGWFLQARASGP